MKKSLIALAMLASMGCSVASSRRRFDEEARGHERRARLDMAPSMMLDALLQLSAAQAVTASAVSTNTIDLGVARDLAPGKQLYLVIGVDVAATASGAATVTFQAITSAAAALSSPTVIGSTDAIGKAELTLARKPIAIAISPAILAAQPNGQRYLGLQYTVATGPLTAGSFTAYLTDTLPPGTEYHASGFTVA